MAKAKRKTIVTPKGVFVYPHLNRPDTKFKTEGEYHLKLRLSAEEAQPLVEEIDAALEAQVELVKASGEAKGRVKRADPPYIVDEETGDISLSFKMKASGTRQDGTSYVQKPGIKCTRRVNGKPVLTDLDENILVGGGTEGKVAFFISPFYTSLVGAGVSLRLKAVQIIKLVEFSSDFGFDAEDGEEVDDRPRASDTDAPFDADESAEADEGDADF